METHLLWIVVGIVLVIAELLTGTFYLLVLGVAAFAAAAAAWLAAPFLAQVLVAGAIAVAGVLWIRAHRRARAVPEMPSFDVGQPVKLEQWVNRADGLARVMYRDALWDAVVEGDREVEPGALLFVHGVSGSTLHVGRQKRA
ncbi:MAG: NfeD family protein [Burkholderiales bacterium]|nr:NfeD family protein [Burkholderiales bacterium]